MCHTICTIKVKNLINMLETEKDLKFDLGIILNDIDGMKAMGK